jgi:2-keto-4-pentenoate hydratase
MTRPEAIAVEVLDALERRVQVEPFSRRDGAFDVRSAYHAARALDALRRARGERHVGRKIGFTNRGIWPEYGVYAPIWGHVYDTTLVETGTVAEIAADRFVEPRIEPEIVLGLCAPVRAGMSLEEVGACVGWVAHGFEIVQSIYADWRFSAADCIAEGSLHGALVVGPRSMVAPAARRSLPADLSGLAMALSRDGGEVDRGTGTNVLDGPVQALMHLAGTLGADPEAPSLEAGEIITTGTLTRAFPLASGQTWSTTIDGYDLPGLTLRVV